MSRVFLLLGGNIGDVPRVFAHARALLSTAATITRRGSLFSSPPWGYQSPNPYLNQALELQAPASPQDFLLFTQQVERDLGRTHKTTDDGLYADRPVDIDILLWDDLVLQSPTLTIPHPRLHLRRFALLPLAELCPLLIHPSLHMSIQDLLSQCPDTSTVTRLTTP